MRTLAIAVVVFVAIQQGVGAQGGFGGPELELVDRFDEDGNGRLDAAERLAARRWLGPAASSQRGFGRRRFGSSGSPSPGRSLTPDEVAIHEDAPLYDTGTLRTIFLRFENDDWADELAAFYNTDVEVPATVVVDGLTYQDVGVHFRGASSYMMVGASSKKSLNLSFNFVHDGQRLRGYRTLNLLNGNGDPSFVRTVLYSEIAGHYLPTPRTNFMHVVINGESWGVYVNAQQFNSDFARDWFDSSKGARWKVPGSPRGRAGMEYLGESLAPYQRLYEIKTRDDPEVWAELIHMFRVLNETPLAELDEALSPLLDIDGVLRFLALEVSLVNSDGYWTRASDYSIYQDKGGQFHVLPHDFNEALSEESGFGFRFGGGGGPTLDPLVGLDDPTKPLRSRLLRVPALRDRYLAYVRDIAETWLDWATLAPLVAGYHDVIAEEMQLDTRKLYSTAAFDEGPSDVKRFVDQRRAYLLRVVPD